MSHKGRADFLRLGDYNAICDRCGAKFKASMLQRDWQGFMVCAADWEPRHPQDFVRGLADPQAIPWARPQPTPDYVGGICTFNGRTAIAGYGTASCAISGFISPGFDPSVTNS